MKANPKPAARLNGLLALSLLLLALQPTRSQDPEMPPSVRILSYTNLTYADAPYFSDWAFPDGNVHNSGYDRSFSATAYSRYDGGYVTNFFASAADLSGWSGGAWLYNSESRSTTYWSGPCPTTAVNWNYWTNRYEWGGTGNLWNWGDQSSNELTNFTWTEPEYRVAFSSSSQPGWTLEYNMGLPHLGCYYNRTNYNAVDTKLEMFSGGQTNSTNDVTIQLYVWAWDNARQRYLTWNEVTVNGKRPDLNNNFVFLMQDNQCTNLIFNFSPTNNLPPSAVPGSYDYSFWAWPVRHRVLVGVDKNRDGSIDLDGTNDLTTADSPHVFWINDDNDTYDASISDFVDANGASTYSWNRIVNSRDLEDFERLAIRFPSVAYYDVAATWGLRLTAPTALKLFVATSDSRDHVQDSGTASLLTQSFIPQGQPGCYLGEANTMLTLPDWVVTQALQNLATIYCLFEAGTAGTGPLQVELIRNGEVVGRTKIYLKLRPITEMYDHFTAGDTTASGVIPSSAPQQIGNCQLTGLDDDYILFVHGWRMEEWERRRFAETAYKRLWWQGYKGRFGLFSWPTEWVSSWQVWPTPFPPFMFLDMGNFNRSEFQAWRSGTALGKLLAYNLNAGQHAGKVRVFAHSMGNVVVGEALRQLAVGGWTNVVHTYVSCQGAVAAHAYDAQATQRTLTLKNPSVPLGELIGADSLTRNIFREYPVALGDPYFAVSGIGGVAKFVNYHNVSDFALGNWEFNQSVKPDSGYQWTAQHDFFVGSIGFSPPIDIVDRQLSPIPDHFEIFAHAAEARCYAIGAQASLAGPFAGEVNLSAEPFNFGNLSSHHSAQFNSSIQARWSFWEQLLNHFFQ